MTKLTSCYNDNDEMTRTNETNESNNTTHTQTHTKLYTTIKMGTKNKPLLT